MIRFAGNCRVLVASVTALLLGACATAGSSGSNIGPPAPNRSWVDLKSPATVFVSGTGVVNGYNQKTGKLTEHISDSNFPLGLASDAAGNLYIADHLTARILVFPPGSTTPSLTLNVVHNYVQGVAVSLKGDVAAPAGNAVYFFKKGAIKPYNVVSSSLWSEVINDTYDAKGNLYVDGYPNHIGAPVVGEIRGGGRGSAITTFGISNLSAPAGIAVDNANHLLVVDATPRCVYQYQLPNPSAPSATIPLGSSSNPFYNPAMIALTKSEKFMYVTSASSQVGRFAYPAGGQPNSMISLRGAFGVAVMPWATP